MGLIKSLKKLLSTKNSEVQHEADEVPSSSGRSLFARTSSSRESTSSTPKPSFFKSSFSPRPPARLPGDGEHGSADSSSTLRHGATTADCFPSPAPPAKQPHVRSHLGHEPQECSNASRLCSARSLYAHNASMNDTARQRSPANSVDDARPLSPHGARHSPLQPTQYRSSPRSLQISERGDYPVTSPAGALSARPSPSALTPSRLYHTVGEPGPSSGSAHGTTRLPGASSGISAATSPAACQDFHYHQLPPGSPSSQSAMNRHRSLPLVLDSHGRRQAAHLTPSLSMLDQQENHSGEISMAYVLSSRLSSCTLGSRKHRNSSLKGLLHLEQYDFVNDVNVEDAEEYVLESLASTGAPLSGASSARGSGPFTPTDRAHSYSQKAMFSDASVFLPPLCGLPTPQEDECEADDSKNRLLAVSPALPFNMTRTTWSLDDYTITKQLHKGYASEVFQCNCKLSGQIVVLKVYKLADMCDLQRVQLFREIRLHSMLQHINIVQFYACFLENEKVVLVQEYCPGGDLFKMVYKCGGRLSERHAVSLVLQPFLTALQYLHTGGIVHRDIKPENVLLSENKVIKIADFGLAIDLNEERANTRAGTIDYMAPEVLVCPTKKTPDENKRNPTAAHYHLQADAWAVGVFAYELIIGAPPFKGRQVIDTARNIMHSQVAFPEGVSELARDFISKALAKHPGDRPTVNEMLHHPWITMFQRRNSSRHAHVAVNPARNSYEAGTHSPRSPASFSHNTPLSPVSLTSPIATKSKLGRALQPSDFTPATLPVVTTLVH